jgi:hypothetical protein
MLVITTRAFKGTLLKGFNDLLPKGDRRFGLHQIHGQDGFEGAFEFLWQVLDGPYRKIVICDLDCFVWDWNQVAELAKQEADVIVSERDIPHRLELAEHIGNPFFWIVDVDRAREVLQKYTKQQVRYKEPYALPESEPFWGLYEILYGQERVPFTRLPVTTHADGIATVSDFFVHTWYSREFEHDPFHNKRINEHYQWAQFQNLTSAF